MTGRRLAFAAFGSAGDLFPFLPPLEAVAGGVEQVLPVVPRGLSAYLRSLGWAPRAVGVGAELRVFSDEEILTVADDGWASWRRTWDSYVAEVASAALAADGSSSAWGADAVVTTDFGVHGRFAAHDAGVPCATLSIYPQHRVADDLDVYGHTLLGLAAARESTAAGRRALLGGDPTTTVLLHDRALLGASGPFAELDPAGFPARPAIRHDEHERRVAEWRSTREGTVVVVSMGSFLGRAAGDRWGRAITAALEVADGVVAVGCPAAVFEPWSAADRVIAVPWVPLDELLPTVDAVVHHGGIGTTFTAIRAHCPAVVWPMAFDQSFNARCVEAAGAGLDGADGDVEAHVGRLVGSNEARDRVVDLAGRLVSPEAATVAVARRCRAALGWEVA